MPRVKLDAKGKDNECFFMAVVINLTRGCSNSLAHQKEVVRYRGDSRPTVCDCPCFHFVVINTTHLVGSMGLGGVWEKIRQEGAPPAGVRVHMCLCIHNSLIY